MGNPNPNGEQCQAIAARSKAQCRARAFAKFDCTAQCDGYEIDKLGGDPILQPAGLVLPSEITQQRWLCGSHQLAWKNQGDRLELIEIWRSKK